MSKEYVCCADRMTRSICGFPSSVLNLCSYHVLYFLVKKKERLCLAIQGPYNIYVGR
jgi:hypothetical protein